MLLTGKTGVLLALFLTLFLAMLALSGCAATGADQTEAAAEARDARIESEVALALQSSPTLSSHDIDVTSEGGVVSLSGVVPSSIERTLAARVVQNVDGVVSVRNNLTSP